VGYVTEWCWGKFFSIYFSFLPASHTSTSVLCSSVTTPAVCSQSIHYLSLLDLELGWDKIKYIDLINVMVIVLGAPSVEG
jgi:hypothetical protein